MLLQHARRSTDKKLSNFKLNNEQLYNRQIKQFVDAFLFVV